MEKIIEDKYKYEFQQLHIILNNIENYKELIEKIHKVCNVIFEINNGTEMKPKYEQIPIPCQLYEKLIPIIEEYYNQLINANINRRNNLYDLMSKNIKMTNEDIDFKENK